LALSFSSRSVVEANMVKLLPKDFTLFNYEYVLGLQSFYDSLKITLIRLPIGLAVNLATTVLIAYPLSKKDEQFKWRKFYVGYFLFTMIFNGGLIPTYLVINQMHMINTIWALVLPDAVNMFYVLLMLNFFRGIPGEIEEAAIVDGASWLATLMRIYLPLSLPSIATVTLFIIVQHWNSWFDGLMYMNVPQLQPLMTFVQTNFLNFDTTKLNPVAQMANPMLANITGRAIRSTAVIVCTVPILVSYPFLQRYFVHGLVMGSVKG
jgi:putative aldouronate transport system permease protein